MRSLGKRWAWVLAPLVPFLFLVAHGTRAAGGNKADVLLSKHNLSVTGPGPVTSQAQDACIFCHTPHSSYVDVKPLWNHTLPIQTYNTYTSSTYHAGAATPSAGASKLCLSCHDGTVALGQTVSEGLIPTTGSMSLSAGLGTNLTNDHPLGISPVDDGQLVLSLFQNPPTSGDPAVVLPNGRVECTSCHDAHTQNVDTAAQSFLVRSNTGGTICLACHDTSRSQPNALNGWLTGAHATATNTVPTTSSFGPYGTVNGNACGNCHILHNASTTSAARLLRASQENACSSCHSGANVTPALRNVLGEFAKAYAHPTTTLSGQHDPAENAFPLNASRHAECADCHNSHAASATGGAASPPGLPAALLGTSGYNGGSPLRPASNEYETCFKCHADSTNKPQNTPGYSVYGRTPRRVTDSAVADPNNLRLKFASAVSRHNVSNPRQRTSAQVPSLRPNMLNLDGSPGRSLAAGTYIYCTDCHSNNQARKSNGTGPNGPHGSTWNHLLERRYDLEVPPATPGNNAPGVAYVSGINGTAGVCYKCHDIDNSILQDVSFGKHNRHLIGEPSSCSTCHDPHGIHGGNSTNNYNLVNFDVDVIGPNRNGELRFVRTGTFQGECYLNCHGTSHNPKRY